MRSIKYINKLKKIGHLPTRLNLRESTSFFYFVFAAHGCSLEISFTSLKGIIISVISIASDIFLLYAIVIPWTKVGVTPGLAVKKIVSQNCIRFCCLFFRILIHKNGKEILNIIIKIEKIGLLKNGHILQSIKRKTKIFLLLHITCFAIVNFLVMFFTNEFERIYLCKFFLGSAEDPTWALVFTIFLYIFLVWFTTALPSIFIIYFYFVCSLFTASLENLREIIHQKEHVNLHDILTKYDRLTNTIFKAHGSLHTFLLLVSCHILFNSFYSLYLCLFDVNATADKVPQSIFVVGWSLTTFIVMCTLSSRINYAYELLKDTLHHKLTSRLELEDLSRALKLCENDTMEFVLLDSITVNKGLVAKAFGAMLSYGIMLVTLGRTANQTQ